MNRYEVHVAEPTELARRDSTARADFEALWDRFVWEYTHIWRDRMFLGPDGCWFMKAARLRPSLSPKRINRALRIPREAVRLRWMAERGQPAPALVAWGRERRWGFTTRACLVVRTIPGTRDLEAFLRDPASTKEDRVAAMRAVGEALGRLHAADLFHRDLACRNVLLRPVAGAAPEVIFIDFPRTERGLWGPRRGYLRRADLLRIARNAMDRGASDAEIRAVLDAAAPEIAADAFAHCVRFRDQREGRDWRRNLWLYYGLRTL